MRCVRRSGAERRGRRAGRYKERRMLLEDAVALRIEQLCIERGMSKYDLFLKSGVPQSTLTSIKKKRSRSVRIKTLYAFCEGCSISLIEFFD